MPSQTQASDEGASRQRSSLCKTPGWGKQGVLWVVRQLRLVVEGTLWRDGVREVMGPLEEGSDKEGIPKGTLQSLKSTALAEKQVLFRGSGRVPVTTGSRQARGRRAGLRCPEPWEQRSFHTRLNMKPLEGPWHA